ncbi:hypothetical protein HA402_001254 [Bradysia odoriphaga]|nr:hypothetical protein HA402_001254 [Bradysia odoriphaga]
MPLLLLKNKRKNDCEMCDGEPAEKIRRLDESRNKKGFMLILNHEFFEDKTLKRPGTRVDEDNLVKTFSKFNFEFEIFKDLNYKQVVELAEQFSNKNFIDFSCLVVAVLSHGEEKNQVSAKDRYYDFDETVVNPIAKNITLLGCPKIFIINACRGYERNVYVSDGRYPDMEVDSCYNCTPSVEKMRTIPYMKEILKLYSCYEGFVSYRNPLFGCRFINSLCKHLNERGHNTPIEEIFKLICNELTDITECMFVQCPVVSSTLTKSFCLGDLLRNEKVK